MHVHESERNGGEERLGKELPERDDDAHVGATGLDVVGGLARPFGREDPQPELLGGGLHRAGLRRATAASAPVGLGDDQRDLVTRAVQRAERGDRVSWGSEVHEAHRAPKRPLSAASPPGRSGHASPHVRTSDWYPGPQ